MSEKLSIAILGGDGIGPEVTSEAVKALKAIGNLFGHTFTFTYADIGGIAIDNYGTPLPQETIDTCKACDTIFLGAIGDPKYDNSDIRPEQGLLAIRKQLEMFANLRPVKAYPSLLSKSPLKKEVIEGVDLMIVRELTSGIYFGNKGRNGKTAFDICAYEEEEILRIVRLAFEEANKRRGKLCLIDKANVLESSRLWREIFKEVETEYVNVETSYLYVDNAAMQMILNPQQFDVVVTSNMFGDIISDECSVIAGSLGLLPSASKGEKHSMFEPVHGSYPQAAGKNIANPMAAILSAAMLLEHCNLIEEANKIQAAVETCLDLSLVTQDLDSETYYTCSEIGDQVSNYIFKNISIKV